ncbi:hypothetical protein QCA50_018534 [Cerrena zonata]|uniref:Uncharacterized protein n=1 Tax=Cerrena zonata TaxID=2478898 RepID=A0AAW0FJX7_9APHY
MAEMVNKFKLWDGLGGSGAGHLTGPYVPSLTSLSDATSEPLCTTVLPRRGQTPSLLPYEAASVLKRLTSVNITGGLSGYAYFL